MSGFGLYIHSPFCRGKCIYCDFNSFAGFDAYIGDYAAAVAAEIARAGEAGDYPIVNTVYFGGGNPAVLGRNNLADLMSVCRSAFSVDPDVEISLEMNPEDAEIALLSFLKGKGFNRLSLGWQTLDDRILGLLRRRHDADAAKDSLAISEQAGFDNINIDLIFGLPGQTVDDWFRDLTTVTRLSPAHISAYALSVEPGTPLYKMTTAGAVKLPDEESVVRMHMVVEDTLANSGYDQYEISNYARRGRECRHNLNYWLGGDYLGFGAGAHSHIKGRRWWSWSDPKEYIARTGCGDAVCGHEELGIDERIGERLILGLRLNSGIDIAAVGKEFGRDVKKRYEQTLEELSSVGLLKIGRAISLTDRGRLLANEAMAAFL